MDRVEEIEKIFHALSFFVIIHVQRDKGQAGQRLPQKTQTAGYCFFQRILVENIKDDDQHNTSPVIICLKKPPRKDPYGCGKEGQKRVDRTGFFHSPYSEQTEKQSKHDILIGKFQDTAVKGKIKGNFRDQGKEKKAEGIFFSVGGMEETFYQQKTENRKGQPPGPSEYLIDLRREKTGRIRKGSRKLLIIGMDHAVFQDHSSDMIDEHKDKSK